MKILVFAASFPPPSLGGSIEYLHNIFANLPAGTVTIHTANAEPNQAQAFDRSFSQRIIRSDFIHHPMEAHKRPKWRRAWQYLAWPWVAFWLILRERPDVVHIGEANTAGLAALLASKIFGMPYLHYVYAEELTLFTSSRLRSRFFWAAVRGAGAVVTVSEYSRRLLTEGGVLPQCIHKLVPTVGVEKRLLVTSEQVEAIRQRYGLGGHRVLLTVGALRQRKGHATVIEALPQILRAHPDVKYVVAGSGDQEHALRTQTEALGLNNQVVFLGRVDNFVLNCLYEICDVFVMPHREVPTTLDTEGCPTVFMEAGAHSKPTVGGNAGGVRDAILDGITGYIIEGTDASKFVATACELLTDSGLARRMGQAGREYSAIFRPETNASAVWDISRKVIEEAKKGVS